MYKLTKEELKALIMNAIMTGTTIDLDLENPPDDCPMEIIAACEYIYVTFLEEKMRSEKNKLDQSIEDLLKGDSFGFNKN